MDGATPVVYSAFKDSSALKPHPNTAEPHFSTLVLDARAWGAPRGVGSLYNADRFPEGGRPRRASPDVMYETDTGPKMGLAKAVAYSSHCRHPSLFGERARFTAAAAPPTSDRVGPGSYSPAAPSRGPALGATAAAAARTVSPGRTATSVLAGAGAGALGGTTRPVCVSCVRACVACTCVCACVWGPSHVL